MSPLAALTGLACRRPRLVVLLGLLLTALALWTTASRFAMTTDTTALFSPDVPWRAAERRFDAAFPQQGDVTLVVIDGATPELAEAAAAALATRLAQDPAHVRRVTRPDGGAFFARNGLLFGSTTEVQAATARMIEAQPFLGPLAADPSLRGIAGTFGLMLDGVARGQATLAAIDKPMRELQDALAARAAGNPTYFSWQALLGTSSGPFAAPSRRLVLLSPVLDPGALMAGEPSSDAIRAAARALGLDAAHGVTIRLTGSVPLADEEFASLAGDAWLVALVMVAAMLVTLRLAVRSWRVVAAIALTTLAGLAIALAVALLVAGRLNLISVAFIPLFVGLGIDFGIQLGIRFQAERLTHAAPAEAMIAAARALGTSLLVAAGAVCLGFLAFVPTAYVGIAELGLIASMGMVIALLLSVTLLPALLMLIPPRQPAREIGTPGLAWADAALLRHRGAVLAVFAVAMLLSIVSLAFVRFDFNPLHLRAADGEAMATLTDLMHDPDRNPNTIDIAAPDLAAARALAPRLEALPQVRHAVTVESFVPTEQAAKLAAIADARLLLELSLDPLEPPPPPTDAETIAALQRTATALRDASTSAIGAPADHARALATQFAALAAATPANRAQASALLIPPLRQMLGQIRDALSAEPVSLATLPPELRSEWLSPSGVARIQLVPKIAGNDNGPLADFVAAVLKIAPATGPAVSMQAAAHTVAISFVQAGLLALAIVTALLFVVLRSVREVAFTLAPVVLSGFLTLGTCVLIGQPINFANIIAFPLLFGVGTAFHIYFVMAWRGGAEHLLQSPLARAVFFSALATGSAFGALWISHHPGTASMGKILMISLAWTLVCALIFEPALLGPQRKPRP